jgi:hypothetical protein
MTWTRAVMTMLGLSLNEGKTSIRDDRKDRFEFLGYSFGPHYWWKNGQRYLGASPSKKECAADQGEDQRAAGATKAHDPRYVTG